MPFDGAEYARRGHGPGYTGMDFLTLSVLSWAALFAIGYGAWRAIMAL